MAGNIDAAFVALGEVVTLEDARHGKPSGQPKEIVELQFAKPRRVVADLGLFHVENFSDLREVGLGIPIDFFRLELRTRLGLAGRIANARRVITNDEDDGMPSILKAAQQTQHHGMPNMEVRRRRVHADLETQLLALLQTRDQVIADHDVFHGTSKQRRDLGFTQSFHTQRMLTNADKTQ